MVGGGDVSLPHGWAVTGGRGRESLLHFSRGTHEARIGRATLQMQMHACMHCRVRACVCIPSFARDAARGCEAGFWSGGRELMALSCSRSRPHDARSVMAVPPCQQALDACGSHVVAGNTRSESALLFIFSLLLLQFFFLLLHHLLLMGNNTGVLAMQFDSSAMMCNDVAWYVLGIALDAYFGRERCIVRQ